MRFIIVILAIITKTTYANMADNYCGEWNCYHIMGVDNSATQADIKKKFRELSRKYHPDKSQANNNEDTTQLYQRINMAYETLGKVAIRQSYDSFLDDPDLGASYHYYNYYKAFYLPQTDPSSVITISLALFSIIQYTSRKGMHNEALNEVMAQEKFKYKIKDAYAEAKGKKTKEQIIKELKKQIKITGTNKDPKVLDMAICQFILIPWFIVLYFYTQIRWQIVYRIMRREYTDEDKILLTKKHFEEQEWENFNEEEIQWFVDKELWIKQNLIVHQEEQKREKEIERAKYLRTNKGKQEQRYEKWWKTQDKFNAEDT